MRHLSRTIRLFTLCYLLWGNWTITFARIVDIEPAFSIPFTIAQDNRIYVTASVNGSDSLRFLVDTGASSVVLNPNSPKLHNRFVADGQADNTGTSGENVVRYSSQNHLRVGEWTIEPIGCVIIEYPADYWDGVLGLSVLSQYNVEINYDDFKLYLYPKSMEITSPEHCTAFPIVYHYSVPFISVPIKLKGTEHNLILEVDTGSDRVIDINTPFVEKHRLLEGEKPFAISRINSSDGGSGELKNVFFDEVRIGHYRLPLVAGAYSTLTSGMQSKADIDGMIGNNFLKRFHMVIDFQHGQLYLQPNSLLYSPFYDFLIP